jgi:hypothetical protein
MNPKIDTPCGGFPTDVTSTVPTQVWNSSPNAQPPTTAPSVPANPPSNSQQNN